MKNAKKYWPSFLSLLLFATFRDSSLKRRLRRAVELVSLLMLFLLSKTFLDARVFGWIGKQISFSVEINVLFDGLVLVLTLLAAVSWIGKFWRGLIPSSSLSIFLLSSFFIYAVYRWDEELNWDWLRFSVLPNIAYIDVLWLIVFGQFLLWLNFRFKWYIRVRKNSFIENVRGMYDTLKYLDDLPKNVKSDNSDDEVNGFFHDEPLGKYGEDRLGYEHYAEKIAARLLETQSNYSFAIGINGKWGSGKTSFMDLIIRKSKDSEHITVRFNPWRSRDPEGLIDEFFNVLSSALKPYHGNLEDDFKIYSKRLSNLHESTFSSLVKGLNTALDPSENETLFDRIQKKIVRVGRRIMIYIDDLDRLSTSEIREVLRLIRNTANFRNTYFIVAYDREYVVEAIRDINERDERMYLEKIFQLEVALPSFDEQKIWDDLVTKLEGICRYDNEGEVERLKKYSRVKASVLSLIQNRRDVNRLLNALLLNYLPIKEDVLLEDFLALEVFRQKFPSIYRFFAKERDLFLDTKEDSKSGMNYLILKKSNTIEKTDEFSMLKQVEKYSKPLPPEIKSIEHYLDLQKESLKLSEIERMKCLALLRAIFFSSPLNTAEVRENNIRSIRIPSNYDVYFKYTLDEDDFAQSQFTRVRQSNELKLLTEFYDHCVGKGLTSILINRIRLIRFFDSSDDFSNVVKGQFYLAKKFSENGNYYTLDIHKDFLRFFEYSQYSDSKKFYPKKGKYKTFLLEEIRKGTPPYIFEGRLLKGLYERRFHEPLFLPEEIRGLHQVLLQKLADSSSELHKELIALYKLSHYEELIPSGHPGSFFSEEKATDEARITMSNFVLNQDRFKANMEILILNNQQDTTSKLDPFLAELFGSDKEFCERVWSEIDAMSNFPITEPHKELTKSIDDDEWFNELRRFLNSYQTNEFTWVEGNFKVIKVRDIQEKAYKSAG